jgi:N-carbamoyl-L-amino-acid hydrolase
MDIRINLNRLKDDLGSLSQFGQNPKGGVTRPSFSKADLEARRWLRGRIEEAGLDFRQDGAGNIFGRFGRSEGKVVMAGSHLDTVVNGGRFDGSVGVLAALECLRTVKEKGITLAKPLEVVSFTDEEGNLVGDFLGSRAFTGQLNEEDVRRGATQIGPPLKDILAGTEFTIDTILGAHRNAPPVDAYLELHIEQDETLDTEGLTIGIVDQIAGKHYRWCSFIGKTGHAATTPLELRADAFLGLADFALKATRLVAADFYGSMVTIGKVNVLPGTFSNVPGQADFSFEFRSTSKATLRDLEKTLFSLAEDVASTRGLVFASRLVDKTEPVTIPARIFQLIKEECDKLGHLSMQLPSGPGHDAQILAGVADVGMIFIPCVDGISHSPQELIRWEDLENGANLLLQVLIRLAQ